MEVGLDGLLAHILNGKLPSGVRDLYRHAAEKFGVTLSAGDESQIVSSRVSGDVIYDSFQRSGWKGIQMHLLFRTAGGLPTGKPKSRWVNYAEAVLRRMAPAPSAFWMQIPLMESLVFEKYGFLVMECSHGKHRYISDDRRRTDCPRHRFAGQQYRTRVNAKRRAREQAVQKSCGDRP